MCGGGEGGGGGGGKKGERERLGPGGKVTTLQRSWPIPDVPGLVPAQNMCSFFLLIFDGAPALSGLSGERERVRERERERERGGGRERD